MNFGLRVGLVAGGITLLGLALLCYEDEEKKIQSRIEEYWVRLSDAQRPAYEWHGRLAKQILVISNRILDRLFGVKFLSWQFVSTSVSISSIAGLLSFVVGEVSERRLLNTCIMTAGAVILALLARAGTRGGWRSKVTAFSALPIMLSCFALISYQNIPAFYWVASDLIVGTLASLAGDVAAIWVFRRISMREFKGWAGIWFGILGAVVAALSLLVLPAIVSILSMTVLSGWNGVGFNVIFLLEYSVMDLGDFLLIGMVFGTAITIVVHHLLWPFVLRGLYSIQRMGFSRIRTASWSLGLAMVGCGIAPSLNLRPVWELIRRQIGG